MGRQPNAPETPQLVLRRIVSDSEAAAFRDAAQRLQTFLGSRDLFHIVRENELDVIEAVEMAWNEMGKLEPGHIYEALREVNRTAVNYLASFRFFLEHTKARLKVEYGRKSGELNVFKEACDAANLNFRLVYGLRDYVLHRTMPYDTAEVTQSVAGREGDPPTIVRALGAKKGPLRSGYRFWTLSEDEWNDLPDTIPIHKHFPGATAALRTIDRTVCNAETSSLKASAAIALDIVREAFDDHHHGVLARTVSRDGEADDPKETIALPLDLLVALGLGEYRDGPVGPYFAPHHARQ